MMGHKLVEHKVPKTEPRMDVSDAYAVIPFLVNQISKGMLTLPRMHETPKGPTRGEITTKRAIIDPPGKWLSQKQKHAQVGRLLDASDERT
jgi:hypothetical protein